MLNYYKNILSIYHTPHSPATLLPRLLPPESWPVLLAFPLQLLKMLPGIADVDQDGLRRDLKITQVLPNKLRFE